MCTRSSIRGVLTSVAEGCVCLLVHRLERLAFSPLPRLRLQLRFALFLGSVFLLWFLVNIIAAAVEVKFGIKITAIGSYAAKNFLEKL